MNYQKGEYVVIEEGAMIGEDCILGHHVVVHAGVRLGKGVRVGDHTVLGKETFRSAMSATTGDITASEKPLLEIGDGCIIGASCVLYAGAILGEHTFVGDLASIREACAIGTMTVVGKGVTIENGTKIGNRVKIETGAYITAFSAIEDYCFIAPEVTFTNDRFLGRTEARKSQFKGPTLKKAARIGANATILPGIVIGEDALVAAGSVVTKDLEGRYLYMGSPAKRIRGVPQEQLIQEQSFFEE